jgi:hypothetical protein
MPTGTVISSVKDVLALVLGMLESAKQEIIYLTPPSLISLAGTYYTIQSARRFIQNGGVLRGIIPISRVNVEEVRTRLDIGEDVRHSDEFHGIFMVVADQQQSISGINLGIIREYALDTPITAFWSESPDYMQYLITLFESAWSQSVPAEARIQQLLRQHPSRP